MKIYIQAEDGQAAELNFFVAQQGFRELGFSSVLFEDIDKVVLDADCPIVGYAGVVLKAVERLGCPRPAPLGFPSVLEPLAGRRLWRTTLQKIKRTSSYPIFIKPLFREKAFEGLVLEIKKDLAKVEHLEGSLEVLASEVVSFVSEYRLFVLRKKLIGCRHYKGDFRSFPELGVADRVIELYQEAPVAYVIDLGITSEGKTLLIEINDGFSVGAYGLSPRLYARFLEARWWQMTQKARVI